MEKLNFYRAIGLEEYGLYKNCSRVLSGREWVEYNLEKDKKGFSFFDIKSIVDAGGWIEDKNYTMNIPRDMIIRVNGALGEEFQLTKIGFVPLRYENIVPIEFSRAQIVYDPRATILNCPLQLEESLIPELPLFRRLRNL